MPQTFADLLSSRPLASAFPPSPRCARTWIRTTGISTRFFQLLTATPWLFFERAGLCFRVRLCPDRRPQAFREASSSYLFLFPCMRSPGRLAPPPRRSPPLSSPSGLFDSAITSIGVTLEAGRDRLRPHLGALIHSLLPSLGFFAPLFLRVYSHTHGYRREDADHQSWQRLLPLFYPAFEQPLWQSCVGIVL